MVSDYVLFSGCAAEHDRTPVRAAALAVARVLGPELADSGVLACCGARSYSDPVTPDSPHLLAPLLSWARKGARIVCLSPSCTRALSAHLAAPAQTAPGSGSAQAVSIIDYVEYLCQGGDFSPRIQRSMAPLQVMVHHLCLPGHRSPHVAPTACTTVPDGNGRVQHQGSFAVPADAPATPEVSLAEVVGWTGAVALGDASLASGDLAAGSGEELLRRRLVMATAAGAEVFVTPCHLCFSDFNRLQRTLDRDDPARGIPVLHLAQLLGLACNAAPVRIGLTNTAASGKRVLMRYVV